MNDGERVNESLRAKPQARHRLSTFDLGRGIGTALAFLFILGCGPAAPKTVVVVGTVTWKGEPVPDGDIIFEPVGDNITSDHAEIRDGAYEADVKVGNKRVRILATRESDKFKHLGMQGGREQYLPARYNSESTLTATIRAGEENRYNFALTEK
jgi:hypothetical protein